MPENGLFEFCEEEFDGTSRLFPLPNLVMFPNVVQALHIFEPRYVQMIGDALASDRLFSLALLNADAGSAGDAPPPIRPVVCLCQVITHTRLPNGNYNLLAFGLRRARVVQEVASTQPYRSARLELLQEPPPDADDGGMLGQLMQVIRRSLPDNPLAHGEVHQLLGPRLTLSSLTDLAAYSLDLDMQLRYGLLCESNPISRARIILDYLRSQCDGQVQAAHAFRAGFPAGFSSN